MVKKIFSFSLIFLFLLFLFSLSTLFLFPQKTFATHLKEPCDPTKDAATVVCDSDQTKTLYCQQSLKIWAQLAPCDPAVCTDGACGSTPPACGKTDESVAFGTKCCNATDQLVTCSGNYKCEDKGICPGTTPVGPPPGTPASGINAGDTCIPNIDAYRVCSNDFKSVLECSGMKPDKSGHMYTSIIPCPAENCAYGACGGGETCTATNQPITGGLACCYPTTDKPVTCNGVSTCGLAGACPECLWCDGGKWNNDSANPKCLDSTGAEAFPVMKRACSSNETCKQGTGCQCTQASGCAPSFNNSGNPLDIAGPPLSCAAKSADGKTCASINTGLGFAISTDVASFTRSLVGIVLSIAGGIAILLIIISGYRLMVSQGNPENIKNAREQLTAAIVGLLFVIFSLVILQVIGVNILGLPGFSP